MIYMNSMIKNVKPLDSKYKFHPIAPKAIMHGGEHFEGVVIMRMAKDKRISCPP